MSSSEQQRAAASSSEQYRVVASSSEQQRAVARSSVQLLHGRGAHLRSPRSRRRGLEAAGRAPHRRRRRRLLPRGRDASVREGMLELPGEATHEGTAAATAGCCSLLSILASTPYCFLLLAPTARYCSLLLTAAHSYSLLLATARCYSLLLAAARCCSLARYYSLLLAAARCCSLLLAATR